VAILEIVCGGSDILKTAFAVQRAELEKHMPVVSIDLTRVHYKERKKVLASIDMVEIKPKAVLLRGIDQVDRIIPSIGKIPFFIDHCTPCELGKTSPLRASVVKARRIYCYSLRQDVDVRRTGSGAITVIPGPFLPSDTAKTPSARPVIAVLELCSKAPQVLARLSKIREQQNWEFDIVSPLRSTKALQVANNFEAVEAADFVVAPYEDKDFGQPHEGALLALALGRPMTTSRTEAFNVMGFPSDRLIPAKKHQIGTYAAAVGNYLHDRNKYDAGEWPEGADPYALPTDLLTRF
jgi:hypothetical protein